MTTMIQNLAQRETGFSAGVCFVADTGWADENDEHVVGSQDLASVWPDGFHIAKQSPSHCDDLFESEVEADASLVLRNLLRRTRDEDLLARQEDFLRPVAHGIKASTKDLEGEELVAAYIGLVESIQRVADTEGDAILYARCIRGALRSVHHRVMVYRNELLEANIREAFESDEFKSQLQEILQKAKPPKKNRRRNQAKGQNRRRNQANAAR